MSPTPAPATERASVGTIESDRRLHRRYPITLTVEYKLHDRRLVQRQGFCRTVNISSGGILLDLGASLPSEGTIQLSIRWPFLLADSVPLKLMVWGEIIRRDGNRIAVEMTKYQFHTATLGKSMNAVHL